MQVPFLIAAGLLLAHTAEGAKESDSSAPGAVRDAWSAPESLLRMVTAQAELALGAYASMPSDVAATEGVRLLEQVCSRAAESLPATDAFTGDLPALDPRVSEGLYEVLGELLDTVDAHRCDSPARRLVVARSEVEIARRVRAVSEHDYEQDRSRKAALIEWRLRFLENALQLRDPSSGDSALALEPMDELAEEVAGCANLLTSSDVPELHLRLSSVADSLLDTTWISNEMGARSHASPHEVLEHTRNRSEVLHRILSGRPSVYGFEAAAQNLARVVSGLAARVETQPQEAAARLYETYELAAILWQFGGELSSRNERTGRTVEETWSEVFSPWVTCEFAVLDSGAFQLERADGDVRLDQLTGSLKLPAETIASSGPVAPCEFTVESIGADGAVFPLRCATELGLPHYRLPGELDYRLRLVSGGPTILAHASTGRAMEIRVPDRLHEGYTMFVNLPEEGGVTGPMGLVSPPWTKHFLARQIQESLGSRALRADAEHPLRDVLVDLLGVPAEKLVNEREREEMIRERQDLTDDAVVQAGQARELQRQFGLRASTLDGFPSRALIEWLSPLAADVLKWSDLQEGVRMLPNEQLGDEAAGRFSIRNVLWIAPRKE